MMQSPAPRTNAEQPSNRLFPFWLLTLGSGLIAGSLAAFVGEFTYEAFHKEPEYPASFDNLGGSERAVARAVVRFKTKAAVDTNKAVAAYGLLGVAVGVALGLAGGSGRAGLRGAAVGGVLGGIAGAGLSIVLVPLYFQLSDATSALPLLFLTHAAIFAAIGGAGGAALSWESADHRKAIVRCAVGGAVGAVLATLVVEVIDVAAFGITRAFEPVPAKIVPRFLVDLFVAFGAALGAFLASRKHRRRQA
jgi:hypothetical protein